MQYNFAYTNREPGLIYILCDLSEKMKIVEELLQDSVKSILTSYLNGCVSGTSIRNHLFIMLIGYGNGSPHVLQSGWAKDWGDTLLKAHTKNEKIIEESLEGMYECESVWKFVKEDLSESLEYFLNNTNYLGLASPHIINITNRKPSNEKLCEDYINEIKNVISNFNEHNTGRLSNIMISTIILLDKYDNSHDLIFMTKENKLDSKKVEFWKSVVSEMEDSGLRDMYAFDFENSSQPLCCCCLHDAEKCYHYAFWMDYD